MKKTINLSNPTEHDIDAEMADFNAVADQAIKEINALPDNEMSAETERSEVPLVRIDTTPHAPVHEREKTKEHKKEHKIKKIGTGLLVASAFLATGLQKEGDIAERDALADEKNRIEVVNNNPDLFSEQPSTITASVGEEDGGTNEAETVPYVVQPGDTPWELGRGVEANIDRIEGNQDIRPFVDDIVAQSNEDGNPGLQVGEVIDMPAAADRHQNPGYQDSPK